MPSAPSPRSIEWPTAAVAIVIAGALGATLLWGDRLPVPLTIGVLAVVAAWYNSLQHEIIHGHPTPWPTVNRILGSVPVTVVVPFERYRDTHLAHHRDEFLTDPELDPESFYVTAAEWERRRPAGRALLVVLQTLAGRMVLGPPVYASRFWLRILRTWRTEPVVVRQVAVHMVRVGVLVVVVVAAPLRVWEYVVGAVWCGASLSLVRSFAEHRDVDTGSRTAVVRSGRVFSLLFLHNNLHATHHAFPGLPWYRLPAIHGASPDAEAASAAGAGVYTGYGELFRRYLFRPTWIPVHHATQQVS